MSDNTLVCENDGCGCRVNSVRTEDGYDKCAFSGLRKYCVSCARAFDLGVKWANDSVSKDVSAAQDKIVIAQDGLTEAVAELDSIKS